MGLDLSGKTVFDLSAEVFENLYCHRCRHYPDDCHRTLTDTDGCKRLVDGNKWDRLCSLREGQVSRFVDDNLDGMILRRGYGCPICGERKAELLIVADDGVTVDCASCGAVFDPIEEAKEARHIPGRG